MKIRNKLLHIFLCTFLLLPEAFSQMVLEDKIVALDRAIGDQFGLRGVSIDGDFAVVGANAEDAQGSSSGAAYLFQWDATQCQWVQVDKILAQLPGGIPDGAANDQFGMSVSISGTRIAVGAFFEDNTGGTNAGSVYMYDIFGTTAVISQKITAFDNTGSPDGENNAYFGFPVKLSGDLLIVGAHGEDEDEVGVTPLNNAGAAYVYRFNGITSNFQFDQKLVAFDRAANDLYGFGVSISGNYAVVGAHLEDQDATGLAGTMTSAGSAYIYNYTMPTWNFSQKLVPVDRDGGDYYGYAVDIEENNLIVTAVYDEHDLNSANALASAGSAYMYRLIAGTWTQETKISALVGDRGASDFFGVSCAIRGDRAVVGACNQDLDAASLNPLNDAGAAYVFTRIGTAWPQTDKLDAPDRTALDNFGYTVGISDEHVIVGAFNEDEDDNLPTPGNNMASAGSAYIYGRALLADQPTLDSDPDFICSNDLQPVNLTIIAGNLNDAQGWVWYQNACGTTPIGFGTNIVVNPTVTTTYCAQGVGCFATGPCNCITVDVFDPPTVSLDPVPTIDLCTWNGNPIALNGTSSGGYCEYMGPGVIPTTNLFDPIAAGGPGTYYITFWCEENGCRDEATQIIEVISSDNWHQTTYNSYGRETGYDAITDASGNVYVTGFYSNETTFNGGNLLDQTIVSGASALVNFAYVAKYDDCGNLLWVAKADATAIAGSSFSFSIALDETGGIGNEKVYITGFFEHELKFNSSTGSNGVNNPLSFISVLGSGRQGYVARFQASDGLIEYLDVVSLNQTTELKAITANETNGKIYIGGQYNGVGTGYEYRGFMQRYTPGLTSIGTADWTILDQGNGNTHINDMDFDETNGNLWTIGQYTGKITFNPGTGFINNGNVSDADAFVTCYADGAIPTSLSLVKGNAINGLMTGSGISVNNVTGFAYMTGTYTGSVSNIFQFAGHNMSNTGNVNAYFAAMLPNGSSAWSLTRNGEANAKEARGTSVSHRNGAAYFTGIYTGDVTFSGTSLTLNQVGAGSYHIYVVSYDESTGLEIWANATETVTAGYHVSNGITTDLYDHAFVVGDYMGEMGYQNAGGGIPNSGNLISSGVDPVNIYTLRVDLTGVGDFKMQHINNSEHTDLSDDLGIALSPNPTDGLTKISIDGFNEMDGGTLQIISLDGRLIHERPIVSIASDVDLTALESGIYMIRIINGSRQVMTKVVVSK